MYNYNQQIQYLTANPHLIRDTWIDGIGLFKYIGNGELFEVDEGCLTMIRESPETCKAVINGEVNEEITKQIAEDERIPIDVKDITAEHLPVFKEWQERIDAMQTD